MKIAILTQPLGTNYGGMVQAYALQKVLKDHGHDVVTIDRQFARRSYLRRVLSLGKYLVLKILGKEQPIRLTDRKRERILSENHEFIKQHINMSKSIFSTDEVRAHFQSGGYDAVVVGSDQTWRPRYSPDLFNFYLDFALDKDVVKISYASSFGVDEWEYTAEQTAKCRELIKQFSFVGVRETSGVRLCVDYLGREAVSVLDPTLLLLPEDYSALWSHPSDVIVPSSGYVFAYVLDETPYKSKVVRVASDRISGSVWKCQPKRTLKQSYQGDLSDFSFPAPAAWLRSFAQSSMVITDSFHGCVFSIIFNKPFIAVGNERRGLARFQSLLSEFGLSDRLILDGDSSFESLLTTNIDWVRVNKKLAAARKRSVDLLLHSLEESSKGPTARP